MTKAFGAASQQPASVITKVTTINTDPVEPAQKTRKGRWGAKKDKTENNAAERTTKDAAPTTETATTWVTVVKRKVETDLSTLQLRADDLNAPTILYQALVDKIDITKTDIMFRQVVYADSDEQFAAAAEMVAHFSSYALTMIRPANDEDVKEKLQLIPFDCSGKLMMRQCIVSRCCSLGQQPPVIKNRATTTQAPPVIKASVDTTVVIRFVFDENYIGEEIWKTASKDVRGAILALTAEQGITKGIQDVWGARQERLGKHKSVTALVRVSRQHLTQLLGASGVKGVFTEPRSWKYDNMPTVNWEWVTKLDDEEDTAYLARAVSNKPMHGVGRGDRQLVLRRESTPDQPVSRMWQIDGVSSEWTDDTVLMMLKTVLPDAAIVRGQRRGPTKTWWFRATTKPDVDLLQVPVCIEDGDDSRVTLELWAKRSAPRENSRFKVLPMKEKYSSMPFVQKAEYETERVRIQAPGPVGNGKPADTGDDKKEDPKPVNSTLATQSTAPTQKDPDDDDVNMSQSQAKCLIVERRKTPAGMTLKEVPRDGNCLFSCVGIAANPAKALSARQVRAETVAHLCKHTTRYEDMWDTQYSKGKALVSFEEYIKHIAIAGVWGGYM